MSTNWYAYPQPDGQGVFLVHAQADEEGPIWSGAVALWRGAPSVDDHPELKHGFLGIGNPDLHREFIRHDWTFEIPDFYGELPNFGDNRRYLVLQATGGVRNWTLVLRLPFKTPQFVWKAITRGFHASLKETAMKPAGPDQTAKSVILQKGDVPAPKPPPPAVTEGANSIIAPTG